MGDPVALAVVTQPETGGLAATLPLTVQPVVGIEDAGGNAVTTGSYVVTATHSRYP